MGLTQTLGENMKLSKRVLDDMAQANSLLCNIGLALAVKPGRDGQFYWVIMMYDGGAYIGDYVVYKHRSSMYRAAWRLYRQHTGD